MFYISENVWRKKYKKLGEYFFQIGKNKVKKAGGETDGNHY